MSEFKKIMKRIKTEKKRIKDEKKILKEEEERIKDEKEILKEEEERIIDEKEILKEKEERIKEEEERIKEEEILSRTIETHIINFDEFYNNKLIKKLKVKAKDEVFTKIIEKLREIVPQNNKYLREYHEYYGRYPSSSSPLPPSSSSNSSSSCMYDTSLSSSPSSCMYNTSSSSRMYDTSSSSSCMYDTSSYKLKKLLNKRSKLSPPPSLKIPKSDLSALPRHMFPLWIKEVTSFHGPGIMENSIFLIKDEKDYFRHISKNTSKNTSNNSPIELIFGLLIDNIFYYIRVSLSNLNVTIHSDIHKKYFI